MAMVNIPSFFHTHSKAFMEILTLAENNPNDMEFGKKAREIINEYRGLTKKHVFASPVIEVFEDEPKEHEENDGDLGGM